MYTLKKSLVVSYYQNTALSFLSVYIGHAFNPMSLIAYTEPLKRGRRNQACSLSPQAPSYIAIFNSVTKYGRRMTLQSDQDTRVT